MLALFLLCYPNDKFGVEGNRNKLQNWNRWDSATGFDVGKHPLSDAGTRSKFVSRKP